MSKIKILCVDDEPNILKSLLRVFRDNSFEILIDTDPIKALEQLRREKVEIIISDYRMEPINGLDFLKRATELQPDAHRIILSGYAQDGLIERALEQKDIHYFMSKPFQTNDLRDLIRNLIDTRETSP